MTYLKQLVGCLLIAVASGCNEEETDLIQTRGTQLESITFYNDQGSWVQNFFYDTEDQIIKIENTRSFGVHYDMEYDGNRLIQFTTTLADTDTPSSKDSLLYNAAGQISEVHQFAYRTSGEFELSQIYKLVYDENGYPIEKRYFQDTTREYYLYEKFYWEDGNVVRSEYYDSAEELSYEFFYTYDDQPNPIQYIPYLITEPLIWSSNNVLLMNWTDHRGNLDIICQPCQTTYEYNLSGYPVRLESDDENMVSHIAQGHDKLILRYRPPQ